MLKHVLDYLEEELGFSVCIHERDFMPGKRILENIQNAIEKSRRTIAVISRLVCCLLSSIFLPRCKKSLHVGFIVPRCKKGLPVDNQKRKLGEFLH